MAVINESRLVSFFIYNPELSKKEGTVSKARVGWKLYAYIKLYASCSPPLHISLANYFQHRNYPSERIQYKVMYLELN